jgi:hypothetical protein
LDWDEQHLIALINRMRLFAPHQVIAEAEDVIKNLIQISLKPRLEMQELARTALTDPSVPDLLFRFSVASQTDLNDVYRRSKSKRASNGRVWNMVRTLASNFSKDLGYISVRQFIPLRSSRM